MNRKICPHCKTDNPENAVFCKKCGALFRGEPEFKKDNRLSPKSKNIIITAVCIFLLVLAFVLFKAGSAPKTTVNTTAPAEQSSTLPTTLPPTLPPTTAFSTTAPATEATTAPTTAATTTAAVTTTAKNEPDFAEICNEYNTLITDLKSRQMELSVKKTTEVDMTITHFSLPVSTDTLNKFIKNLLPLGEESYTFSNGIANEDSKIKLASYIPPVSYSDSRVTAENVKNAQKASDGTITLIFKEDKSSFANGQTAVPPHVSTATDHLDFATFALGPIGVTKAEIAYPETKITAQVDSEGDLLKLTVSQPVKVSCTGGVGSLTADISMDMSTVCIYEITY